MPRNNWSRGIREAQHHARQQARIEARQNGERSRRSERRAAAAERGPWLNVSAAPIGTDVEGWFQERDRVELQRISAELQEAAYLDREARVQRESTAYVNSRDRYGEEGFTAEDVRQIERRLQIDERTR